MYKLLLSWRYLRTRWIALASIISVTLGVATMIVVNSVMAGFTHEMQNRIHNILSDVVVESHSLDGFYDPEMHMQKIERVAGKYIAGMTPTVVVPAMLNFRVSGEWITRQVNFIGIDERTHAKVSDFSRYLQHPNNRRQLSFDLQGEGYDVVDHQGGPDTLERTQMEGAGWRYRRWLAEREKAAAIQWDQQQQNNRPLGERPYDDQRATSDEARQGELDETLGNSQQPADDQGDSEGEDSNAGPSGDPFQRRDPSGQHHEHVFDPAVEQHTGVVLGIALASYRNHDGRDNFLVLPGDDVKVSVPTAGQPPKVASDNFTIVDFYESKMNEYDSGFVFVPMQKLQQMRGMIDPTTGIGKVTAIQIKLKDGVDGDRIRDLLRKEFSPRVYGVNTWRDKQGALLAAVEMETAILNVLLFMIIAVAGFGILAIFYMIVVEKTRDIGILKSLGAPGRGIMGIFLAYGLSLGMVGSGVGLGLGLLFVCYINEIAAVLGKVTGRQVFDPAIYYFQKIPTIIDPLTVAWIVIGALLIAVLASILPARRAARLHPVEALRYE